MKKYLYLFFGGLLIPFIFTTCFGAILFIRGIDLLYEEDYKKNN